MKNPTSPELNQPQTARNAPTKKEFDTKSTTSRRSRQRFNEALFKTNTDDLQSQVSVLKLKALTQKQKILKQ
jgi:hypothetical protein